MSKSSYSSLVCDSYEGDLPWLESADDFDCGEDCFKTEDDYPLKRRQRRQRLHSLHCYVARTGVVAVVASASMLTRQVENLTRQDFRADPAQGIRQMHTALFTEKMRQHKGRLQGRGGFSAILCGIISSFKTSLCCAIQGAAARLGGLATGLANAIGEPPHRVLAREEQDAPLLLFWAINLCALCTLASLTCFILTFCAGAGGVADVNTQAEAVGTVQVAASPLVNSSGTQLATADGKKLEGLLRVLGVVGLSLISGCGLGLRHPIQSALLSGF